MKTLLITGAAGFLGKNLTHSFSQMGWRVFGVDRVPETGDIARNLSGYAELSLPHSELPGLLKTWRPDACIHAAGSASVPLSMQNPAADFTEGPALTFYLLDTLRQNRPECSFVYLSSAAVYGNPQSLPVNEDQPLIPISAYGYHKWQSELICQEFSSLFGLKTASARLFSAYGIGLRRQVLWDICFKALVEKRVILQGDGTESRDFVHASDIALAMECILNAAAMHGEAYNVASGDETSINYLSRLIMGALDIPLAVQFSGKLPGGTPLNWRADISKISTLGFAPQTGLDDGVNYFARWCKKELLQD